VCVCVCVDSCCSPILYVTFSPPPFSSLSDDEGETQWFTYTWWNSAQAQVSSLATPGKRFFTVNRAFQPGMQRYPATTWTGDDQDCSHAKTLGYVAVGQLYHECDMTSPTATVLVRQYQNAILSPIFRVHQMHGTPRFPFLWGSQVHADAMRSALNLRYALIPHLYSLAHIARRELSPLATPASWYFNGGGVGAKDSDVARALETTYLYGGTLLPSDVSVARHVGSDGVVAGENTTTVFLPPGALWFLFNTTMALPGGQTLSFTQVPLGDYKMYARGDSLLALQGGTPIQHTGQLGGTLDLHIYAGGGDAEFTLYEDDGESLSYDSVRATTFSWHQTTLTLSWAVLCQDGFSGSKNDFTNMRAVLFGVNASEPLMREGLALLAPGNVSF